MIWLLPRRSQSGEIAGAWLFLYGIGSFLIEFLRGDPGHYPDRGQLFGGTLSTSQGVAVCLVIAGGMLWLKRDTVVPSGQISKVA
jgi:prolipoprotein diacylglyceryltransferase